MRDEIVAGMRNALARGQSLEQAAKSFVSAGYNPQEVNAAYQELSTGVSTMVANPLNAPVNQISQVKPSNPLPTTKPSERKNAGNEILITLIVISMIILLGAIGYFFYAIYIAK